MDSYSNRVTITIEWAKVSVGDNYDRLAVLCQMG